MTVLRAMLLLLLALLLPAYSADTGYAWSLRGTNDIVQRTERHLTQSGDPIAKQRWYVTDLDSSVVATVSQTGMIVERVSCSPFREMRVHLLGDAVGCGMTDELRKLLDKGLGDFRLAGASWSNDGEDLVLALQEPGGTSSSRIMLRLVWATNVTIRMDFAEYVGMPLLVESRFESLARERWLVEFTFGAAPDGFLRCECNEIAIISGEAAAEPPC